ncbi:MFS transporter [Streptomyces phaeochromogenes]|uniref:MFS transporter n=1 Tax=Streptomyces phaeochromogenes TaxID=1923 RepID=UPI003F4CFB1C
MPRMHPPTTDTGRSEPRRVSSIVAILTLAGTTIAFVQSMVFPIVPHLPGYLNASSADTAWAVTATLLCGAVTTPVTGRLGDMYGKRRMLLCGMAVMVVGTVISALSHSLAPLLVGRTLQGLGNGVIPLGVSIMREVLPAEKLPTYTALMYGSFGVGGSLGLPVAALIAANFDWHVLFWTAAALSTIVAVLVALLVPESKVRTGGRFDLAGAVGMTAGLICLLLAVSKGEDWGWGSGTTVALFVGAATILPLWGRLQLRSPQPMVDLRANARPQVLLTHLTGLALGFALFATNLVLPQLLQTPEETGYGLGKSLVVTGLLMAPQGMTMMAVSPLSARLTKAKGAKVTLMTGSVIMGVGYLLATVMMSEVWQIVVTSCIVAIGVGFALGTLPALLMGAVPMSRTAATTSLNTLMRSIGTSVCSAVAGVILAHLTVDSGGMTVPSENGLRAVLALGVGASAIALVLASFIPRQRAAEHSAEPPALAGTAAGRHAADSE